MRGSAKSAVLKPNSFADDWPGLCFCKPNGISVWLQHSLIQPAEVVVYFMEEYMKKLTVVLCVLSALIGLALCGCSRSKKDANAFVLGLDDSFPPLGFRDEDNKIVGYDIDLAAEVCRRLDLTLVCQPIDWKAKELELNTGKIDCIWNGFTMTADRRQSMTCTPAYLNNAQVLVVRAGSGIQTLSDMEGKVVGVQTGSSAQEAIDDTPDFVSLLKGVVEFNENITALNDLGIGNIDGVVMDEVVANYSITQTGKPFVILDEGLAKEEYGIAFKKGNTELCEKVWNTLLEMEADGTVGQISAKWFGANLSVIGQ